MKNINLSELTQSELLSLRLKVNSELINYENRHKKKVYFIYQPFKGYEYFKTFEEMWNDLVQAYEGWDLFDDNINKIEFGIDYISEENYNRL